MKILYCNISHMDFYDGMTETDKPVGGGGYEDKHETNNFTSHNGRYYGFVQGSRTDTIDIGRLGAARNAESVSGVLVVWLSGKHTVVGYYKNAAVYRVKRADLPPDIAAVRDHDDYNITSAEAVLIPTAERVELVDCTARHVWFNPDNKDNTNERVLDYIEKYEAKLAKMRIEKINAPDKPLTGEECAAVVKVRVNQDKFRSIMLGKYGGKCCICGMDMCELLTASHIKPWADSDSVEKLSADNGLLLCPAHDKLFDRGFISFDDSGRILISESVSPKNRELLDISGDITLDPDIYTPDMRAFMKYHRENIFINA